MIAGQQTVSDSVETTLRAEVLVVVVVGVCMTVCVRVVFFFGWVQN